MGLVCSPRSSISPKPAGGGPGTQPPGEAAEEQPLNPSLRDPRGISSGATEPSSSCAEETAGGEAAPELCPYGVV